MKSIYGDTTSEIITAVKWWFKYDDVQAKAYIAEASGGINNPLFAMLVYAKKEEPN